MVPQMYYQSIIVKIIQFYVSSSVRSGTMKNKQRKIKQKWPVFWVSWQLALNIYMYGMALLVVVIKYIGNEWLRTVTCSTSFVSFFFKLRQTVKPKK